MASEHTWNYDYDKQDRLRFVTTPAPAPGGTRMATEYQYDEVGNRSLLEDARGQIVRYLYDARNSLAEVQQSPDTDDPNTSTNKIRVLYDYDDFGYLKQLARAKADARRQVVDYAFDGLGRLRRETQYPSWPSTSPTPVTSFGYDPNGNLTQRIDPLGQPTSGISFAYDPLNRLSGTDFSDPATPDASYTYDPNGNLASMSDGTGLTSYQYDERNQLTQVDSPGPRATKYRYTRDGRRKQFIYPDGKAVNYGFDNAARLVSLVDWNNRTTSYEHRPDGRIKKISHVNGTSANFAYDNALRLSEVSNKDAPGRVIDRHTYTLEPVRNRVGVDEVVSQVLPAAQPPTSLPAARPPMASSGAPDSLPTARPPMASSGAPASLPTARLATTDTTTTYTYDRQYRLTGHDDKKSLATTYSYDERGNRETKTVGATSTTYTYYASDRLSAGGSVTYGSDANGNRTSRGSDSYAYDQANRLKSATVGGTSSQYSYDGASKRTSKTVGATTTTYSYDVGRRLPVMIEDGARKYVWGPGLAYATDASGANVLHVYHKDALGSVWALSDANGQVTDTYQRDPFGVPGARQGTSAQPFGFAGEPLDSETGLLYLRARMYDPETGRFIQRDPFAGLARRPGTLNRYVYVGDNPVNRRDRRGLQEEDAGAADPSGDVSSDVPSVASTDGSLEASAELSVEFSADTGDISNISSPGFASVVGPVVSQIDEEPFEEDEPAPEGGTRGITPRPGEPGEGPFIVDARTGEIIDASTGEVMVPRDPSKLTASTEQPSAPPPPPEKGLVGRIVDFITDWLPGG